ncbi:MAG: 16S rRNA (cytidine(1402)-2'-O)-methyltransferase [Bifidobacteriaceae bacterium]|nr:16S rRNA (cytidine(1402)-2'-O)-methyltransferase [Bifidobacteriaceae bacterium]
MFSNTPTGGIVLAATPLGDPRDASQHLRELLATADVVAAEDTRRLRTLAARLDVNVTGRVLSFFDHNERSRIPLLLEAAQTGVVLVVSDAGTPLVSDPGFALVRAAIAAELPVTCAPGPSAVLVALALSGLPSDRFAFDGFVPRAATERAAWLDTLVTERRTVVVFDSPRRLATTLADAAARLGPERPAAVARELTKPHQEIQRGSLAQLAQWAAEGEVRGEVTLVLGGAPNRPRPPDAVLVGAVRALTAAGWGLKDAVAQVAGEHGASKRALYQATLASTKQTAEQAK